MYHTYILINKRGSRTYTGHTANLEQRLKEHNEGNVILSRLYRPYLILLSETFSSLKEAKQREAFYKSSTGRYQLKRIVAFWKTQKGE